MRVLGCAIALVLGVRGLAISGEVVEASREGSPRDPRKHWAFRSPLRVPPPPLARHPIDGFLEAARRRQGLVASPPIAKDLWLRRVTLDLLGLPPTAEEREAFRADDSEQAAERVIDRLLASPQYGERWARHWMDIWRYSDWYGLGEELRFSHYHIWRWRDWIIESLNADLGYDQMVLAMLAGDELAPEDPATLRATGFLVRQWDIFNRNKWLDATIEHSSRAFLGITMQCARCHDHKFDPISQVEYYQLRAIFEPYHIRIDRVPGQSDRAKDGIARAFDDFLTTPTHLFVRGDETQPDSSRALAPATPAALGGELVIQPIALPRTAQIPDKRAFVIAESRAAADQAIATAAAAVETARQALEQSAPALAAAAENERRAAEALQALAETKGAGGGETPTTPEALAKAREAATAATAQAASARQSARAAPLGLRRAQATLVVAEVRRVALGAELKVEQLEDEGLKESKNEAWSEAARQAVAAQRQLALAQARLEVLAAEAALELAQIALDGRSASAAADPKNEALKQSQAQATTALVEARSASIQATKKCAAAEALAQEPPSTDHRPRALEFPRAKTTYRDDPSQAPYAAMSSGRRLAFARWLVDRRNPLTARVAVNHLWARHFGEPLVAPVFDFGLRSPRPLHGDLLDWLALELIDSGWSMKRLHRLMLSSDAYRMRSWAKGPDDPNLRLDADNRGYWRMNPRRMEAEAIRDSLLFLAGRLDNAQGGRDLPTAAADDGRRRTIYYRYSRDERMPFVTMFDAPSVEECYRRHETIVPQQALALTNSKLALDRADEIAVAIAARGDADFVKTAFEQLLGRAPTEAEEAVATEGLARLAALPPSSDGAAPTTLERARSALIHVLLNHNDFITIR